MASSTTPTLYQSAILQDDKSQKYSAPTSTTPVVATHAAHVRYTTAHPFAPEFVQGHLTTTNSNKLRAQALYDERVRRRQISLAERRRSQASSRDKVKEESRARAKRKNGAGVAVKMGRREAAEKGVWRLREDEARWDAFVPLHRLWLGYMSELLGLGVAPPAPPPSAEEGQGPLSSSVARAPAMPQPAGTMHAKLIKADFHGSIMTVRRSKNAALVGASGIVVQETENTFKVVTRKNKSKVLPKQGSVFAFAVPLYSTELAGGDSGTNLATKNGEGEGEGATRRTATVLDDPHVEIELYGNQFCFRSADRAGRKFKHKESIEL